MTTSVIDRLKIFIPSIKGISSANKQGLLALANAIEAEQLERFERAKSALEFYADHERYQGSNQRVDPLKLDPYTETGAAYMQDVMRDNGDLARSALRTLK